MQAIILAAGIGRRLGKLTKDKPKCMVRINGKAIIQYALESIQEFGIGNVILVTGHAREELENFVKDKFPKLNFTFVYNKDYASTNNIYSLYLARNLLLKDDTILLESDILFESRILKRLLEDKREVLAVVDKYQSWMDGTVVKLDSEDNITAFIPKEFFDYSEVDEYYKTVNIYKFSKEFMKDVYIPFLEAYVNVVGRNEYYELVLRVISFLEKANIKALRLEGEKWYEIDTLQDVKNAECIFAPNPDIKLKIVNERYGGYWRFPFLRDFCYLVNPFFPSEGLKAEMNACFSDLIIHYPSTLSVLNHLASVVFNINEEYIVVGNGASELISALSLNFQPTIGVMLPTFNEYISRFKNIVTASSSSSNYSYSIEELITLSKNCDAILLINPDNPSGNYISRADVLDLINYLDQKGKFIILDESFIDFSEEQGTLLNNDILEKFKNLIIIKSLGKSYGVPGLRLGILATSNFKLIEKIKEVLPIWNINSTAEFFLQIFNKYKQDYLFACKKVIDERRRLYQQLKNIPFLQPLPSQANYFMCRVLPPYTAEELTKQLLWIYDILIKDLSHKHGIEGEFVRISVKTKEENDLLLDALVDLYSNTSRT